MKSEPPRAAILMHAREPVALDATALARLRELDPDGRHGVLMRVLQAFQTSLERLLTQLQAEAADGNAVVVLAVAHTLKASSASVGALQLSAACAAVELRLRSGAAGDLDAEVEQLLTEGGAALLAVTAMLRA